MLNSGSLAAMHAAREPLGSVNLQKNTVLLEKTDATAFHVQYGITEGGRLGTQTRQQCKSIA